MINIMPFTNIEKTNEKHTYLYLHKGDIIVVQGRRKDPPDCTKLIPKIESFLENYGSQNIKIKKIFFDDANGNCGTIYIGCIIPDDFQSLMATRPCEGWINEYIWHIDWDICSLKTIADSWEL